MTKAEFDFKLSLGLQLFNSKFNQPVTRISVDINTYRNLKAVKSQSIDEYTHNGAIYTIFIYVQVSPVHDCIILRDIDGDALNLLGEY